MIKRLSHTFSLALLMLIGLEAEATEKTSTLADQSQIHVTIYNNDLALIRDQRQVHLEAGINRLAIRDVSAHIQPETALLRSLSEPGAIQLLEQNFDFDLLTPQKMLEKNLGRQITWVEQNPATGQKVSHLAKILSTNEGLVLQVGKRIFTNPPGYFVFSSIPENLRDKPTLVTLLHNQKPGIHTLELAYLSTGLSWQADYVAQLDINDTKLDLAGWVTLTNASGTRYPNAHVQLVAGDVNRIRPQPQTLPDVAYAMRAPMPTPSVRQEALFEYHLYTLERPTTLANNQTKQVALLNANGIHVNKRLLFKGQSYYYLNSKNIIGKALKAEVHIQFDNTQANHLGMPLPKGVVRVYKADRNGQAQFIGEDRIDHTPNQASIDLKLGDAFDITAKKVQTRFQKRNYGHPYKYAAESSYRIELKNGKKQAVHVVVQEPIPHDWKILEESHPHETLAANLVEWRIEIPPEKTTVLEYRVLIKY